MPDSKCSLRENPKFFCKISDLKITHLRDYFFQIFLFDIYHFNSGLAFKNKNYYTTSQNCAYFKRENSQNLLPKSKWALWMKQQDSRSE
jgi:hypothetical protein